MVNTTIDLLGVSAKQLSLVLLHVYEGLREEHGHLKMSLDLQDVVGHLVTSVGG